MTTDEFCTQYAANECSRTATLCGVDALTCQATRKVVCSTKLQTWTKAPRYFHPGKAGNCLGSVTNLYKKDTITPADMAATDETCNRVFSGDVKKDASCTSDYDCADVMICDKGVCETKVVKGSDALCADPGAVCSTGFYCAPRTGSTVLACQPKKSVNDPCDASNPCKEDLRCVSGSCVARAPISAACTSDADCVATAPFCDANLSTPMCAAGLRFATGGADCVPYGGGSSP